MQRLSIVELTSNNRTWHGFKIKEEDISVNHLKPAIYNFAILLVHVKN